jgi:hypothetical protein
MDILDDFTPHELREIFRNPTKFWPEDFCNHVHRWLADNLLDEWLGDHTDDEYREEIRSIIEEITYGYTDENGNEMLEFDEDVENDGQMRLF